MKQAVAIVPNDVDLPFALGKEFMDRDALGISAQYFNQAVRIQPGNAELRFKIGLAYIEYLDLEEDQTREGHPHYRKLVSYSEKQLFNEALENVEQAVSLRPDDPDWHLQAGLLFDRNGSGLDAIYHLRMARELYMEQEAYEGLVQEGRSEDVRRALRRYYEKYGYRAEDFELPGWLDNLFQ